MTLKDCIKSSNLSPQERQDYLAEISIKYLTKTRNICNKTLIEGDLSFSCYTCSDDVSVVYCQECFLNSDHTGHNWYVKNQSRGQCDCGDYVVMKDHSYCKNHQHQELKQQFDIDESTMTKLLDVIYTEIKQKTPDIVISILKQSFLLTRLAAIVYLLTDEDITIQQLLGCIQQDDYSLFYEQPKMNQKVSSLFAEELKNLELSKNPALIGILMPSDQFFRNYSLRQLGLYSNELCKSDNEAVLDALIQCLNEPYGLYLCQRWDTLNQIMSTTQQFVAQLLKQNITIDNYEQKANYQMIFQSFQFNRITAAIHTILFSGKQYIQSFYEKQLDILSNYCLNVNHDFTNNQNVIISNYRIAIQMQLNDSMACNEFLKHIQLKYVDGNDQKELQQLLIDQITLNITDKSLCVVDRDKNKFEFQVHLDNITMIAELFFQRQFNMVIYDYYVNNVKSEEFKRNNDIYNFLPDQVILQYLNQLFKAFRVQQSDKLHILQDLIDNLNQRLQIHLNVQTFIKILLHELIKSLKIYFLIDCQCLQQKQNIEDFSEVILLVDNEALFQLTKFESLCVIREFIQFIDDQKEANYFLENIFDLKEENPSNLQVFILFMQLVAFVPDTSSPDFLKYIIANMYNNCSLSEILDSNLGFSYSSQKIIESYKQLYDFQTISPLQDDKVKEKNDIYKEPALLQQKYEEMVLNSKMYSRCINSSQYIDINVLNFIQCNETMIQYIKNALALFNHQQLNITGAVACIRLLKCCEQYVLNENGLLLDFPFIQQHYKLQELLVVSNSQFRSQSPCSSNISVKANIRKLLQNKQSSMLMDSTSIITRQETDEECCSICHMQLDDIHYLPAQQRIIYNSNLIDSKQQFISIFKVCGHKFHHQCIENQEDDQCSICKQVYNLLLPDLDNQKYKNIVNKCKTESQSDDISCEIKVDPNLDGFMFINMQLKVLEFLLSSQIDFQCPKTHNLVIQFIKSTIQIIRSFSIHESVLNRLEKQSKKIGFINSKKSYQILRNFLTIRDSKDYDKILFELLQAFCDVRKQLIHGAIYQYKSCLDIFRHFATQQPLCACKSQINLNIATDLTLMCLKCGKFSHSECCDTVMGFLVCPHCKCSLGLFCIQLNSVIKSTSLCHTGPFINMSGEHISTIFTQEMTLREQDMNYLQVLLLLGELPEHLSYNFFVQLGKRFPRSEIQEREIMQLNAEDRLDQQFLEQLNELVHELIQNE